MNSIADYRRSLGLTQTQFAALLTDAGCPCTQGLISHWERGAVAVTPERARQIEAVTAGVLRKEALVFGAPGWSDHAFDLLGRYAVEVTTPWTCEAFNAWAAERGLSDPPDARALGRVLRHAIRRGVLIKQRVPSAAAAKRANTAMYSAAPQTEAPR